MPDTPARSELLVPLVLLGTAFVLGDVLKLMRKNLEVLQKVEDRLDPCVFTAPRRDVVDAVVVDDVRPFTPPRPAKPKPAPRLRPVKDAD